MGQERQSLRDQPPRRIEMLGYLTDSDQSDVEISEELNIDGLLPTENSSPLPAAVMALLERTWGEIAIYIGGVSFLI